MTMGTEDYRVSQEIQQEIQGAKINPEGMDESITTQEGAIKSGDTAIGRLRDLIASAGDNIRGDYYERMRTSAIKFAETFEGFLQFSRSKMSADSQNNELFTNVEQEGINSFDDLKWS